MARVRTFVAVDISAEVRRNAKTLIHALSANTPAVRWVAPENLHLTVKFLGDVEDKSLYGVCRAVKQAVADLEPFRSFCAGVGAFPNSSRPRTIWMGLHDVQGRLSDLHQRVDSSLGELGFTREVRQFRPHVTIGRVDIRQRRLGRLAERLAEQANSEFGSMDVEECTVYSSELSPKGPVYTTLGRLRLGESG